MKAIDLKKLLDILSQVYQLTETRTVASPVEELLEAMIDLSMLLRDSFSESSVGAKKNPGLIDLDEAGPGLTSKFKVTDPLGNARLMKVIFKPKIFQANPQLVDFFTRLASFCLELRRGRTPIKRLFMSLFKEGNPSVHQPPKRLGLKKEIRESKKLLKKQANFQYLRRQRRQSK